ncbi:hypothetical protein [Corynebacterium sp. HMSC078A10]|uniref:hypothetical protein n=1 Tax=Corynebacterium sp. HMSC078A10 TaxID=1739312 RepID=UPI0008A50E7C|nr:hypothetical protein [Corynebacterium sp. HMSC078A10]OFK63351.1 hypothetical protein HMPREF2808_08845 [Corynebacterium sp. HMSC078A10]
MPNVPIPEFLTKLSSLSANARNAHADKTDLSRRIAALVYSVPHEPLMLGSLVSLCLWDQSPKRCRFTCDAFANSSYPWAGKIYAQKGITDSSAAWQIKRRNQLSKLSFESPAAVAAPIHLILRKDELQIANRVITYDDRAVLEVLEAATNLVSGSDFTFEQHILSVEATEQLKPHHAEFLAKLAQLSRFLPFTIIFITDSAKTFEQIFDEPDRDYGEIYWFIKDSSSLYSFLGTANAEFPSFIPTRYLSNLSSQEVITVPGSIRFHRLVKSFGSAVNVDEMKEQFNKGFSETLKDSLWSTRVDAIGNHFSQ